MRIRILAPQLNSAYGTFHAGHIVEELPDDVAAAWVRDGVAEVPIMAAKDLPTVLAEKPELDEAINTDDDQPIVLSRSEPTVVKARLGGPARPPRRTSHPSAAVGPTWGDKG